MKEEGSSDIRKGYRPVLMCLAVSGMYWRPRCSPGQVLLGLYNVLVLLMLAGLVARFSYSLAQVPGRSLGNAEFVISLSGVLWTLQVLTNFLVTGGWVVSGGLEGVLGGTEETAGPGSGLRGAFLRRRVRVLLSVTGAVYLLNLIMVNVLTYACGAVFRRLMLHPFHEGFSGTNLVILLGMSVGNVVWLLPLCLLVLLSSTTACLFREHQAALQAHLHASSLTLPLLEDSRRAYHHILRVLERCDGIFGVFAGFSFMYNSAVVLFIMYSMVYLNFEGVSPEEHTTIIVGLVFWLAASALYIMAILIAALIVHHHAGAVEDDLFSIELKSERGRAMKTQVLVFLSKIQKSSLGFSVFYMFVIDKPAVLSVVGILLTYFILLIQFGMTPTCSMGTDIESCSQICKLSFNSTT